MLAPLVRVAVLASAYAAVSVACAQTRPEYGIREDQPSGGSMLRRQMVGPTVIPINLPYEQLSAEDRSKFNENYEAMAVGDEPPFPLVGLKVILDPIRKAQAKFLVTGELFVVAKVNSAGETVEVAAFGSPSAEMTKFASTVLLLTKFKPAVCSGKPCAMEFPLRMNFEVR